MGSASFAVVDTETTDKFARKTDKPEPWNSLVYDLGYIICDNKGNEIVRRSFVIAETFNAPHLMNSAYYADKLPQYRDGIRMSEGGEWVMVPASTAYFTMREDFKKHNVKTVWAFNCNFDIAALNSTIRTYSNGFVSFFMPYGVRVRDIWDYADCITGTKRYCKWAASHGFFTATGNPQTSAEKVYAYLIGKDDYTERHTALSDCEIELAILIAAKRKHTKKTQTRGRGWVAASKIHKNIDCLNTPMKIY